MGELTFVHGFMPMEKCHIGVGEHEVFAERVSAAMAAEPFPPV